MGLEQVNGQYTEGAKVQARAALIMEQLKDAHGDVIRTSGSTENQIKRMNAAFEELRVMVGTKLLPVITPLIEKIASALNWFTQLPVPVQNTTIAVVAIAAALGPVILGLGGIVRSEEHTSEVQSLMRISYAVFCLKKKKKTQNYNAII